MANDQRSETALHGHAWSDARSMHHRRVAQFTAVLRAQDGENTAIREIESLIFMNGLRGAR